MVSLAVLLGLCSIVAPGCARSVHAFHRARHTALPVEAERDGVRRRYPTRRCRRAVDVSSPRITFGKAN